MGKTIAALPLISVIVPVYNAEDYLGRCLDSIIEQTYTNLEIILVDDGSTDRSGAICDEYRDRDDRIHVIHKENGGASSARNRALDISTGTYISFVDNDDWINVDHLEIMMKEIGDSDVCVCGIHSITDGQVITEQMPRPCTLEGKAALEAVINGTEAIYYVVWNKLYKAETLRNVRFANTAFADDFYFTPRALYNSRKTTLTNKCWYNYSLRRPGSILSTQNYENWLNGVKTLIDNAAFFQGKGEPNLAQMSARHAFMYCISLYEDASLKKDQKQMEKSYSYFKKMKREDSSLLGRFDPIRLVNDAFIVFPDGIAALHRLKRKLK